MKRVRYAIGVMGMTPALALPFTTGAGTAAHVPGKSAKRVTLTAEQAPATLCHHQADHSARASGPNLAIYADWDNAGCVWQVQGKYKHALSDRNMLVNGYSEPGGRLIYQSITNGFIHHSHNSVSFLDTVDTAGIGRICAKIDVISSGSHLAAGPQCVNT